MSNFKHDEEGFLLTKKTSENVEEILVNTDRLLDIAKKWLVISKKVKTVRPQKLSSTKTKTIDSVKSKSPLIKGVQSSSIIRKTPEQRRETSRQISRDRENKKQTDLLEQLVKLEKKKNSSGLLSKIGDLLKLKGLLSLFGKKSIPTVPGRDSKGRFTKGDGKSGVGFWSKTKNGLKNSGRFIKRFAPLALLFSAGDILDTEANSALSRKEKNIEHGRTASKFAGGLAGAWAGATAGAALGSVVPVIGNIVGALLGGAGGLLGAYLGSDWVGEIYDAIVSKFDFIGDAILSAWQYVINNWDGIVDKFKNAIYHIGRLNRLFKYSFGRMVEHITNWAASAWGGLKESWSGIAERFTSVWDNTTNFIANIWSSIVNGISDAALFFWNNLAPNWFKDTFDNVSSYIKGLFQDVTNFFKKKWNDTINSVAKFFGMDVSEDGDNLISQEEGKKIYAQDDNSSTATVTKDASLQTESGEKQDSIQGYNPAPSDTRSPEEIAREYEKKVYNLNKLTDNKNVLNSLSDEAKEGLRQDVPESIAGGMAHAGTYGLILDTNQLLGNRVKKITAINDAYHTVYNPNSKHNKGLAFDFTVEGVEGITKESARKTSDIVGTLRQQIKSMGLSDTDFSVVNEYDPGNRGEITTGGHIHVQFNSQEAADKYLNVREIASPLLRQNDVARGASSDLDEQASSFISQYRGGNITDMDEQQTAAYAAMVAGSESGFNYSAVNSHGFVGAYQLGAAGLEDVGLIKKGASKKGNKALNNPDNWNISGGLAAFLLDKDLQDRAFRDYTNKNISYLRNKGVNIASNDYKNYVEILKSSHLAGVGNYSNKISKGIDFYDANGQSAIAYGKSASESSQKYLTAAKRLVAISKPLAIEPIITKPERYPINKSNKVDLKMMSDDIIQMDAKGSVAPIAHQPNIGRTVSNPLIAYMASGGIMNGHTS